MTIEGSVLTCLRDDDTFQPTFGKALPRHLGVPSLIEVWPTLKNPYQAQYDVADRQYENGWIKRPIESF